MAERNAKPFPYHPVGCTDTLDTTETSPGAMTALTNLIPDPSTKNYWVCRPALNKLASLPAGSPTRVTVAQIVGDFVYGMASATTGVPGRDIPFAFNLTNNTFVPITGPQDATTLPLSPSTVGDWIPPQSDVIGTKLVWAHQGFSGTTHKIGWLDISTPGAPVYHATNVNTNDLPSIPIAVKQFFGRAYYLCNPPNAQSVAFASDVLDPTTQTNANQVLTFGASDPLTALGTLQFENQLGGIVQALIVFKGTSNMFQVTGDFALTTNPISVNSMNVETGTLSPAAITNTPQGMLFFSPDGMRQMNQNAEISDAIGVDGAGICLPFISAITPSRMVAASNGNFIRVSVQNGNAFGSPNQEWWYSMSRGAWCGPHTCPMLWIGAYKGTFICVPQFDKVSFYQSDVYQNANSTFVENGAQLTWTWKTAVFPEIGDDMNAYELHDCYLYSSSDFLGDAMTVTIQDQFNSPLADAINILNPRVATVWGSFTWGHALWGGASQAMTPVPIVWKEPVQFSRASIAVSGNSGPGLELGSFYGRIQHLGYTKHN